MRYLITFMCVLALGVMGCNSEPDNPLDPEIRGEGGAGGEGGSAGIGGVGGDGGNGGVGGGVVTDCADEEDGTKCATGWPMDPGLCVGGTCEPAVEDCTDREDGTPCWLGEANQSEIGFCEAGGCGLGAPPEIDFLSWGWTDNPCDANASGQSLKVTIFALDDDTPWDQLTYSGQVQDCTGDLNAWETTLTCEVYLGARQSEATVTDPLGNQDTMFFAPDPCTNGCVGDCPK